MLWINRNSIVNRRGYCTKDNNSFQINQKAFRNRYEFSYKNRAQRLIAASIFVQVSNTANFTKYLLYQTIDSKTHLQNVLSVIFNTLF